MKRMLGFLALAGLLLTGLPIDRTQALSLNNPAIAGTARYASEGLIEVRGGHGGHGGRGGGHRFGGGRHFGGGYRHHGFHRRYYAPRYYYAPRRCRVVMTYYGPRRVCRPWRYW